MVAASMPQIDYRHTTIGQLEVEAAEGDEGGRRQIARVVVDGESLRPSERFWTSLFIRYGFAKSIFNYFDHTEVFTRIAEKSPRDAMRVCIERDPKSGHGRLLAVSNPTKAVVRHDTLLDLLNRYDGRKISYHNGVVESHHTPRTGGGRFEIAGDAFGQRFVVRTPVDGFGPPSIYLALLREVCSNGMIGEHRAFRSTLAVGTGRDETTYSLQRALDGFNNDEGYAALRQRFASAASSWASVHEANSLYSLLAKLTGGGILGDDGASLGSGIASGERWNSEGQMRSEADSLHALASPRIQPASSTHLLKRFHTTTGDVSRLYGLANLDALSSKRQKTLPVDCKVYDLLNFATEVATHHAGPDASRRLQAWVGGLISREYDLEGTADQFGDFKDFFVKDSGEK